VPNPTLVKAKDEKGNLKWSWPFSSVGEKGFLPFNKINISKKERKNNE